MGVVVLFCLYGFYSMMYLRQRYTRELPRAADPATGRVIPVEGNYCLIVFATPAEEAELERSYLVAGIAGGCFLLCVIESVWRQRRRVT